MAVHLVLVRGRAADARVVSRRRPAPSAADGDRQRAGRAARDAAATSGTLTLTEVLSLQRTAGNAAVSHLLAVQRNVACPVTGEFEDPTPGPGAVIPAMNQDEMLTGDFVVHAKFAPTQQEIDGERCDTRRGEYRQQIRGRFMENGQPVKYELYGGSLSPDAFQEDRVGNDRYGYRVKPAAQQSRYYRDSDRKTPDQYGAFFKGEDHPGTSVPTNGTCEIDLEFKGLLIDTKNNGKVDWENVVEELGDSDVLVDRTWKVKGVWPARRRKCPGCAVQ